MYVVTLARLRLPGPPPAPPPVIRFLDIFNFSFGPLARLQSLHLLQVRYSIEYRHRRRCASISPRLPTVGRGAIVAPLASDPANQPTPLAEFGNGFDHRPWPPAGKVFGFQLAAIAGPDAARGVFGHHPSRSFICSEVKFLSVPTPIGILRKLGIHRAHRSAVNAQLLERQASTQSDKDKLAIGIAGRGWVWIGDPIRDRSRNADPCPLLPDRPTELWTGREECRRCRTI